MAVGTVISFGKMVVKLGDGGSPEIFTAPCGLTSQALNRAKAINETNIPDCSNPDTVSWLGRDVQSLSWNISGSGVLAREAIAAWEAFVLQTTAKNIQATLVFPTITYTYNGAGHLATLNYSADLGNKVQVEIDIQGDGQLVVTSA